jgi:hypothetical protein
VGEAEEMGRTDMDPKLPQQPEQQRCGMVACQAAFRQHGKGTVQLYSKMHGGGAMIAAWILNRHGRHLSRRVAKKMRALSPMHQKYPETYRAASA